MKSHFLEPQNQHPALFFSKRLFGQLKYTIRYARLIKHTERKLVRIRIRVYYLCNASIYEHFRACNAWLRCDIDLRSGYIYAIARSLDNCVLLRMESAAYFLALAGRHTQLIAQAADVAAMRHSARHAVIASGEDAVFLHDDGPHGAPCACRARAYLAS